MASRYQVKTLYAQQGGVTAHEGIDPLIGLPVLVYTFAGEIPAGLRDLESENIPGVLNMDKEAGEVQVVTAYSKDYTPVTKPLQMDPMKLVMDSLRALKDAAQAGVIHGDIRPERFLSSRDHVLLEGFGMPWRAEGTSDLYAPELNRSGPSFAADVYGWAASVLALVGDTLEPAAKRLLVAGTAQQAAQRPAATELYSSFKALAEAPPLPEIPLGAEAEGQAPDSGLDAPLEFDFIDGFEVDSLDVDSPDTPKEHVYAEGALSDAHAADAFGQQESDFAFFDDPDAVEAFGPEGASAPYDAPPSAQRAEPPRAPAQGGFVKNLPPGATYKVGDASASPLRPASFEEYSFDDSPVRRPADLRRIVLLLLLLVAASVLAYLAWQQQGAGLGNLFNREPAIPQADTPPPVPTLYLVEVEIAPANTPPVDLLVVSSPEGSTSPPGTILRSRLASGVHNVPFDQAGVWQLQARFQNRASEPVAISLPDQRSVTLTLPPPEEPTE